MAVKYVSDFSFPKSPPRPTVKGYARGGHVKATTPMRYASGGLAKGAGVSNDKGHTGHNGPDVPKARAQGDGPVRYYSKGGLAKGHGLSNDSGHVGKNGPDSRGAATSGQGDGDVKRTKLSDKRSPAATRTEKSSGVQSPAFKKGGASTPKRFCGGGKYKEGGSIRTAEAPVKMGEKKSWNKDDAVSPGSFKRTPPSQASKNKDAANSKFSAEGRNTEPATEQSGSVQRMSGWSDFKEGGAVHPRLKNLREYAHAKKGGSVAATRSEKPSGHATSGTKVNSSPKGRNAQYESAAGTPGEATPRGDNHEMKSGEPSMAMGGLSRGTSHKKNAAIHAKSNHKMQSAMGALAGALSGPPPGAPPMGAAPPMGGPPPGAPPMGPPPGPPPGAAPMGPPGGMPHMAGGGEMHVFHHHITH